MKIPLPVLMAASGLWVILLVAVVLFVLLALRFRKSQQVALIDVAALQDKLDLLEAATQGLEVDADGEPGSEEVELLKRKMKLLEANLAEAEKQSDRGEDETLVSRLRLDKLNEKYQNLQKLWEGTNQELIRADGKIAELLGAKAALEKERNMLERQITSLSENKDDSDANTMREVIINFTEESRELLLEIERLNTENAGLRQQIDDMEEGGKGTAGKVVGLQRKLDEAEAQIEALKAGRG